VEADTGSRDRPCPSSLAAPAPRLERLRVVELRALARAAGLPRLARSGRRVELLQALAPHAGPFQRLRPAPAELLTT